MKRKWIGPTLLGLGAFLLVAGCLGQFWAPGVVLRTPLDVNTTTHLSGQADKLDVTTGELVHSNILATSVTKTDSNASDDNVVAWVNTSCVVIDEGDPPDCVDGKDARLITASTDVFATDRVSAVAVNDGEYLPDSATPHDGLVNKWPFDSEKTTYPYWDGTLGSAADAVYDRTEKMGGLEVYVYKVEISDAPIEIAEGVPGTYDDAKEIFVEPKTGSILNQTDNQQRYLDDGTKVLDLQLAFTPDQIKTSISDTKADKGTLTLLLTIVPLVGFIGGFLLLIAGGLLTFLGRSAPTTRTKKA